MSFMRLLPSRSSQSILLLALVCIKPLLLAASSRQRKAIVSSMDESLFLSPRDLSFISHRSSHMFLLAMNLLIVCQSHVPQWTRSNVIDWTRSQVGYRTNLVPYYVLDQPLFQTQSHVGYRTNLVQSLTLDQPHCQLILAPPQHLLKVKWLEEWKIFSPNKTNKHLKIKFVYKKSIIFQ